MAVDEDNENSVYTTPPPRPRVDNNFEAFVTSTTSIIETTAASGGPDTVKFNLFDYDDAMGNYCSKFSPVLFESSVSQTTGHVLFGKFHRLKAVSLWRRKDRRKRALTDALLREKNIRVAQNELSLPMQAMSRLLSRIDRVNSWGEGIRMLFSRAAAYKEKASTRFQAFVAMQRERRAANSNYRWRKYRRPFDKVWYIERGDSSGVINPVVRIIKLIPTKNGGAYAAKFQSPAIAAKRKWVERDVSIKRKRCVASHAKFEHLLNGEYGRTAWSNWLRTMFVEKKYKWSYVCAAFTSLRSILRKKRAPQEIAQSKILSKLVEIDFEIMYDKLLASLPYEQRIEIIRKRREDALTFDETTTAAMLTVAMDYISSYFNETLCRTIDGAEDNTTKKQAEKQRRRGDAFDKYVAFVLFFITYYTGARTRCDLRDRLTRAQLFNLFVERHTMIITKDSVYGTIYMPPKHVVSDDFLGTILFTLGIVTNSYIMSEFNGVNSVVRGGDRAFILTNYKLEKYFNKLVLSVDLDNDKQVSQGVKKAKMNKSIINDESSPENVTHSTLSDHSQSRFSYISPSLPPPPSQLPPPLLPTQLDSLLRSDRRNNVISARAPDVKISNKTVPTTTSSKPRGLGFHVLRRQFIIRAFRDSNFNKDIVRKLANHSNDATTRLYRNSVFKNSKTMSAYVGQIFTDNVPVVAATAVATSTADY